MNTIDSKEANEELVCIWNAIEERAKDADVVDYARRKRQKLDRMLQRKLESDRHKKEFDEDYCREIEKEIKEVKKYALSDRNLRKGIKI